MSDEPTEVGEEQEAPPPVQTPAYAQPLAEGQTLEEQAEEAREQVPPTAEFTTAPRVVSERTAQDEAEHEGEREAEQGYSATEE
jgi:hypothetical protein